MSDQWDLFWGPTLGFSSALFWDSIFFPSLLKNYFAF